MKIIPLTESVFNDDTLCPEGTTIYPTKTNVTTSNGMSHVTINSIKAKYRNSYYIGTYTIFGGGNAILCGINYKTLQDWQNIYGNGYILYKEYTVEDPK